MQPETIQLTVPLEAAFTGLVTAFSEQAARALGLDAAAALKLTLSAEEVFSYLARHSPEVRWVRLEVISGGYYVELQVVFPPARVDLAVFNLTSSLSLEDDSDLEKLGLLIASRSADRFAIRREADGTICIAFRKEKTYPPAEDIPPPPTRPLAEFSLEAPDPQQIKAISHLLAASYPAQYYPSAFGVPGKLADMLASGAYQAVVARDRAGHIGGCFIWRGPEGSLIHGYGPYLFGQPQDSPVAAAVVESCLEQVGKLPAVGILVRYPTPQLPADYFERLGSLDYHRADGSRLEWPHFFRQLQEDPGAQVWAHPELEDFLQETYQRLELARSIWTTRPEGESRPEHSVFAAHLDPGQGHVTLRPLWDGKDAAANLARHLELLRADGFRNLLLGMDLGVAWQAELVPDALSVGFRPRLVIPYGGTADVVIFQHQDEQG